MLFSLSLSLSLRLCVYSHLPEKDYLDFMESLEQGVAPLPSAERVLEEMEAAVRAGVHTEEKRIIPILEYLKVQGRCVDLSVYLCIDLCINLFALLSLSSLYLHHCDDSVYICNSDPVGVEEQPRARPS